MGGGFARLSYLASPVLSLEHVFVLPPTPLTSHPACLCPCGCVRVRACVCVCACVSSVWRPAGIGLVSGVPCLSIQTALEGGDGPRSTPKPIPEDRQLIHVHT